MKTTNKIISIKTNEYRFQVFLGTNIIGVTTIKYDKNFIEFSLIETDRKYQKKGIGKQMILDCIAFVKLKFPKAKIIILNASPYFMHNSISLEKLVSFYESTGFQILNRKKDSVLMKLTLKSL